MQKMIFMLVSSFCLTAFLPIETIANNGPKIKLPLKKYKSDNKKNTVTLKTNDPKKSVKKVAAGSKKTSSNTKLTELTKNLPQRPSQQEVMREDISKRDEIVVKMSIEAYEKFEESKDMVRTYTALQHKYAKLMDVEVNELKNIPLLEKMDYWYGTPYRMGGTTKRGVDCSAFTRAMVDEVFKVQLPRTAREQYATVEKIKKSQLEEGDLVFFNTRGGISHVGIYLGNNKFVHSASSRGVMISDLDENYWSARYVGAGKLF